MDIQEFVNKVLKEAESEKNLSLFRAKERRKKNTQLKKTIENDPNIPEQTDFLKRIEAANGKKVIIESSSPYELRPKTQILNYDPESRRILVDNCISMHFVYTTDIKWITLADTGEVIYENKDRNLPAPMRVALLLGRKEGLKAVEDEEKSIQHSEEYANRDFEETKQAMKKIPEWVERGKNLIYPEKYDQWVECVCYRASDLYHGSDLVNAIEVMEALDKGLSLKEVEKVIDDGHSGASFGMLVKIVTNFSKRGPEFLKNTGYAVGDAEWERLIAKIEKENKIYEQNEKANIKK